MPRQYHGHRRSHHHGGSQFPVQAVPVQAVPCGGYYGQPGIGGAVRGVPTMQDMNGDGVPDVMQGPGYYGQPGIGGAVRGVRTRCDVDGDGIPDMMQGPGMALVNVAANLLPRSLTGIW